MGYDVIGDIHGQAGKLDALLKSMGYVAKGHGWVPPAGRQAVFIGDLIDRGPEQVKVVRTVRAMVDAGHARCVLGNHEFNAIGWVTPQRNDPTQFLRKHSEKNLGQHAEFLRQVGEGSALHKELVGWFRTLPPVLDLGGIRAVHAWWHAPYVALVAQRGQAAGLKCDEFLHEAFDKKSAAWTAMEGLTKGLEVKLPAPHSFVDHGGVERFEVRTRWWTPGARSFREVALVTEGEEHRVPDHPLPADYLGCPVDGTPVFVGHYWMTGLPKLDCAKVACVDWSAAKNGPLVAYRWDGERELDAKNFTWAG